jgi:uncharacterized protein (DUF952 family)
MEIIYHITTSAQWQKYSTSDFYESETLEVEKFIHCSTKDQVKGVLERYYAGQKTLLLLHINPSELTAELKYEQATNAEYFPHIYGKINKSAVIKIESLD